MTGWFPRVVLITFIFQTSVYAVRPMVSYRAIELGAGPLAIGVIASAYAVLSLATAVAIGRSVDRWGTARFIASGVAVVAATSIWLLRVDSLWMLGVNQALMGLGHIMTLLGCQALIAKAADGTRRDSSFGIFMVAASLGQLVGPATAGLLATAGPGTGAAAADPVFAFAGLTAVVASLVGVSLQYRPSGSGAETGMSRPGAGPSRTSSAIGQVLKIRGIPTAMLASLTVLTTVDIIAAYLPLYGEQTGLSVQTVGLLLAARAAASMASRLLMPSLLRALGRRWLLISGMALPALSLLALPLLPVAPLYAGMAVIGFGLGLGQPITLSWVTGRAKPEMRGTAAGVRLTGNRLGQLVLPLGVGAVAGMAGVAIIFPVMGAILLGSAAFVLTAPLDERSTAGDEGSDPSVAPPADPGDHR